MISKPELQVFGFSGRGLSPKEFGAKVQPVAREISQTNLPFSEQEPLLDASTKKLDSFSIDTGMLTQTGFSGTFIFGIIGSVT